MLFFDILCRNVCCDTLLRNLELNVSYEHQNISMKKLLPILLLMLAFNSCKEESLSDPQVIVDKAIEAHGGLEYENISAEFDFRDRHYTVDRKGGRHGKFTYTRTTIDTLGVIKDVLIQARDFKRYLDGAEVAISEERRAAFTSSVNSVLYFALLPYPLNDAAVKKEFLGESEIDGVDYYKIKVTFGQVGGGEDFEDVFCYWFNKESFKMDYLAYSYEEEDGWGTRFRKAINPRRVEGILFQDYINYKAKKELGIPPVEDHDRLFSEGQLEELSRIENENILVKIAKTAS